MNQYEFPKIGFLDIIWRYKYQLALYILAISFLTFIVLYLTGGVPEEFKVLDETTNTAVMPSRKEQSPQNTTSKVVAGNIPKVEITQHKTQGELPTRVIIDKIGVNTAVQNPISTNINVLDTALLKGSARYPGSGTLAQGNMFIFGHSTSIKVVNNQAYKAFNRLKELNPGDTIRITSATKEYRYTVVSVSLADSDKALVDFKRPENMVTLVTCNVLGEKQERFIVEALFEKTGSL